MSISHVLVVDDEADIRALIQEILGPRAMRRILTWYCSISGCRTQTASRCFGNGPTRVI
jgi:CheY-like chemotaxis protein